jgi:hypothetical protein
MTALQSGGGPNGILRASKNYAIIIIGYYWNQEPVDGRIIAELSVSKRREGTLLTVWIGAATRDSKL